MADAWPCGASWGGDLEHLCNFPIDPDAPPPAHFHGCRDCGDMHLYCHHCGYSVRAQVQRLIESGEIEDLLEFLQTH